MAFSPFVPSTTIDPIEMNENFYWCGQGTIYPMGGTRLGATSGSNLGISTATWNTLHCTHIDFDTKINTSDGTMMCLLAEYTLSATATKVDITGLNGDTDKFYTIMVFQNSADALEVDYLRLYPNGVTTTTEFSICYLYASTTINTVNATDLTAIEGFLLAYPEQGVSTSAFGCWQLYAATGINRIMHGNMVRETRDEAIGRAEETFQVWHDSTENITSLTFGHGNDIDIDIGTRIRLFGRT